MDEPLSTLTPCKTPSIVLFQKYAGLQPLDWIGRGSGTEDGTVAAAPDLIEARPAGGIGVAVPELMTVAHVKHCPRARGAARM